MWYDRDGIKAAAQLGTEEISFAWSLGGERLWPVLSGGPAQETGRWIATTRPAWASRLWADDLGLAAEFTVGSVPFVLRWIPPGRFKMGSPEGEAGRLFHEGPRHSVTISRGFWLGETPVTQEQWTALMGENPSHFKGPAGLPVEQVSWHDSTAVAQRLNEAIPGLHAALPTEAQWEYACRAGTESAFNDGSDCTKPTGKDPALDRLGCFDDNSDGKTHGVKSKPESANAWGLFDVDGNVWEWGLDGMRTYTKKDQGDPVGTMEKSASRVVRGGSRCDDAGLCRAAYRYRCDPGSRWYYRGLRLAAGQEPGAAERPPAAEGRSRGRKPSA